MRDAELNMALHKRNHSNLLLFFAFVCIACLGVLLAYLTTSGHRRSRYMVSDAPDVPTTNTLLKAVQSLLHRTTGCVKRVHIFGDSDIMRHIPELKSFYKVFTRSRLPLNETDIECKSQGYDCDIILTMGADVTYLKGKDAVVFGLVPTQFRGNGNEQLRKLVNRMPDPGQTWIYFSTESPLRVMRWTADLNLGRLKYHVLMTYDQDSDIVLPFGYYRRFNDTELRSNNKSSHQESSEQWSMRQEPSANRKGLISWMSSNCRGFWPRLKLVDELRELLPLDDYGLCGHHECLPKRSDKCNRLMAEYKFFLAMPNTECKDYITEKFWMQSLQYGTVPVVLGPTQASYAKVAPPNSFIHIAEHDTLEDLAEYLQELDKDDDAYGRFFDWRKEGEVVRTFPTQPSVFCRALPYLRVKRREKQYKYLSDSPWFNGCRIPADRKTFDLQRDEENELFNYDNWSMWR